MYFKRKVYDQLLEWKEKYADKYAVLLEGARRVGKSTIAESFAMPQAVEAYVNGKNFAGDFLPILIGRI